MTHDIIAKIQTSNELIQKYSEAIEELDNAKDTQQTVPGLDKLFIRRDDELRRLLARGIEYHQERIEKLKAALSSPEADDGIDG